MAADPRVAPWDEVAETYGADIAVFAQFAWALVDLAAVAPGESVLDLGTGNGLSIIPIAERNPSGLVVGADFSHKMLSVAASRLAEVHLDRVDLVRMDVASLGFVEAGFDVVLASSVWQFVNYSIEVLQEWRRVLRPGGRLAFSVPGRGVGAGIPFDLIAKYFQRLRAPVQDRLLGGRSPQLSVDPGDAAQQAGFAAAEVQTRAWTEKASDPETWWSGQWRQGVRAFLRELDPATLLELKEEAISRLPRAPSGEVLVTVDFVLCLATT
jgi:SAM-dependent methyltransferase